MYYQLVLFVKNDFKRPHLCLGNNKRKFTIVTFYEAIIFISPQGPQIRLQVRLISQFNLWQGVISVNQALFGTFLLRAHVPSFYTSYYSLTITLVSAPTSCFTFAVSMREVYCVGCTPRAWDPRSLQSILDHSMHLSDKYKLQ